MKARLSATLGLACLMIFASGAFAQSAKFAASYETNELIVDAYVATGLEPSCQGDGTGSGTANDPCVLAEAVLATIDVAQQKDLLIGVSGQIGLHTLTQAKGKSTDPSLGKASASGSVNVSVELRDHNTGELMQIAAPGTVTFAARVQELKVDVVDTDTDNLTEVTVSLMLDTTAAHHFNFLGVDLIQGNYDVVAIFDLGAFVEIVGEDAIAQARVTLGPRMVTAQEVRAARGSLVPLEQDAPQ